MAGQRETNWQPKFLPAPKYESDAASEPGKDGYGGLLLRSFSAIQKTSCGTRFSSRCLVQLGLEALQRFPLAGLGARSNWPKLGATERSRRVPA